MATGAGRSLRILLIAPTGSGRSNPETNTVGGNRLLSEETIHELERRGFVVDVIDTSGQVSNLPRWQIRVRRLLRFLNVLWQSMRAIRRARLAMVVMAPYSTLVLGSSLWLLCRLARRPLVLRFSGSGLGHIWRGYGPLARWLAERSYMRSALLYVETQQLWREFRDRGNFRMFPNTRDVAAPPSDHERRERPQSPRRLLFLSRLDMDKGLGEALAACRQLPEDCHLRVYGPRMDDTDMTLFDGHARASYSGALEPSAVPRMLREHDLLLFPSYCRAEGYPGVILEAFQCGLPVIAARWGGVPELVTHEQNGLLIAPRSADELRVAIERLRVDTALYRRLCEGAQQRGEEFRSGRWHGRMAADLRGLCQR